MFVDAQSGARTAKSRPPRSQQRNKLQHRPHSKPRLTQVIPASGLSIPKSLPNDVLKVGVHTGLCQTNANQVEFVILGIS